MSYLTRKKEAILSASSVVGYDVWQQWVYLAGLTVGDYADLAAVIASSTARTALTANTVAGKNAMKYMVASTVTIIPAVLASTDFVTAIDNSAYAITTPTMTSATDPSGTVSVSGTEGTYYGYKAFDKNVSGAYSTNWLSAYNPVIANQYIQYAFASSPYFYKAKVMHNNGGESDSTRVYKLQAFINAAFADVTGSLNSGTFKASTLTYLTHLFTSVPSTTTIRLQFISGTGDTSYCGATEIVLYGLDLS